MDFCKNCGEATIRKDFCSKECQADWLKEQDRKECLLQQEEEDIADDDFLCDDTGPAYKCEYCGQPVEVEGVCSDKCRKDFAEMMDYQDFDDFDSYGGL